MEVGALVGFGLIAAVLCVLLRKTNPEYAMVVALAAGVLLTIPAIGQVQEILSTVFALTAVYAPMQQAITVLLRAAGICLLVQFSADTCRDAGETALAGRIEFAGRICVLYLAVPLITEVLQMILALLQRQP